jgi:hypothetical protein
MVKKFGCHWTQRFALAMAFMLLAACGSSSKFDEFIPTRIVSVGDQLSYLGNSALVTPYSDRFTVNNLSGDTTLNNWVLQLAHSYGLSTELSAEEPAVLGTADPVHNKVAELENRLATVAPKSGDMLVVNGGMADIIALAEEVADGQKTVSVALTEITAAGSELQALLIRQQNNYKHILVINAYDLKDSPYATSRALTGISRASFQQLLHDMTRAFNSALISNAGTYSSGVGIRLFDAETLLLNANLYNAGISTDGMSKNTCGSMTALTTQALGSAADQVATLAAAALTRSDCKTTNSNFSSTYLFADTKFLSPKAHQLLGSQAYVFLRGVKGW